MKRLKKTAYSYSQFLYDNLLNSGKDIFNITYNNITKVGDESSEDEQIKAYIEYSISKDDLEYVIKLEEKITEEQWEDFYNYINKINVADFDDLQLKYKYDAMDDIKRRLPNEDLNKYELEYFKFNYMNQDYDTINFKLESRLNKIY